MQLIIYSDDLNAFAELWDPFLGSKDPPEQTRGHQFISIRVFEFAEQKIHFANPSNGLLSGHGSFPLLRILLIKEEQTGETAHHQRLSGSDDPKSTRVPRQEALKRHIAGERRIR
tara:strand:+ start:108 stop:452 length:345 start_codon:yes stop_codon:yes gene_type:complete